MNQPRIAIIGARGIANYGGFETMVGELAPKLVKKDYIVYCSCEKPINGEQLENYNGVKLIYFPIRAPINYTFRKIFECFYDIYFIIKCSIICDVVYSLGLCGGISLLIPRFFGKISIVNIDGIEWRRSKFSVVEKNLLRIFFTFSTISASYIVIDNKHLINYISARYRKKAVYISYGAKPHKYIQWDMNKLIRYIDKEDFLKISQGKFWLVVARLEPENNIHIIIDGFIKAKTELPLVIIGDFTSNKYRDEINDLITNNDLNNKIILLGRSIYNIEMLDMFRQNAFAYIHGHSVGGTNPSLLEAMVMKNIIIAHDNEFNREVGGDFALYFKDESDLKNKIEMIEKNPKEYIKLKEEIYKRVKENYSWDRACEKYDEIFNASKKKV